MLSKKTIEDFIAEIKNMKDWSWVKTLSREYLEKTLDFVPFKTKPYLHQLQSLVPMLANDTFLLFLDMGLGKTKIVLDTLSVKKPKRTLVLSPNISTVSTWADEIEKHSDFSYIELVGTVQSRWENLLSTKADLVLLNYTGLLVMNTESVDGKWEINRGVLHRFAGLFDCLVYDEIHYCKNNRSLTFQICRELSKTIPIRYGLTGTPINRDPLSLWAQFYLIDLGETLGKTLTIYRDAFFYQIPTYWGGIDYKFRKSFENHLNTRILNKSLRFVKENTLDLPEKIFTRIPVELTDESREIYASIVAGYNIKNLSQVFPKLRQICSGFIDDIELTTNKLGVLIDLIKSTPPQSKVVVFLEFIKSGELVERTLEKENIKCIRLFGGTKDKVGVKTKFLNDKSIKVLVANIDSASVGLNLQVANYTIFYEPPLSSIDFKQAIERIHRPGQKDTVFIYSLITKHTIEEKIEKYLKEGRDVFKAIIDGEETLT